VCLETTPTLHDTIRADPAIFLLYFLSPSILYVFVCNVSFICWGRVVHVFNNTSVCGSLGLAVPSTVCGAVPPTTPVPLAPAAAPQKTRRCQVSGHQRHPNLWPPRDSRLRNFIRIHLHVQDVQ